MLYRFYFLILLFSYSLSYIIVLPFNNINSYEKNNTENYLNEFTQQKYITSVSIGTPPQTININLLTNDYRFYIANEICYENSISFYNYSESSTFKTILPASSPFDDLADASTANDKVSFYDNINLTTNKTTDDFFFFFYKKYRFKENSNIYCGVIGLSINRENLDLDYLDDDDYLPTIFSTLKKYNFITKHSWTYEFFDKNNYDNNFIKNKTIINKYDGYIILGYYPHEYNPSIYSGHNLLNIYTDKNSYKFIWNFNFRNIYYYTNKTKVSNKEDYMINLDEKQVELLFTINYIISTKEYFESIQKNYFDYYINKSICSINSFKKDYSQYKIISCEKGKFTINDIKKFPSIYFTHVEFNYTFVLNYDELFEENNNKIYFLIYYQESNLNLWKFGKLFLKKYHFSFNEDSSTIHFYSDYDEILLRKKGLKKNENKSNKNVAAIIILCICLFIFSVVLGLFIGKIIAYKNDKKKANANELEENYDYFSQKENGINDV